MVRRLPLKRRESICILFKRPRRMVLHISPKDCTAPENTLATRKSRLADGQINKAMTRPTDPKNSGSLQGTAFRVCVRTGETAGPSTSLRSELNTHTRLNTPRTGTNVVAPSALVLGDG